MKKILKPYMSGHLPGTRVPAALFLGILILCLFTGNVTAYADAKHSQVAGSGELGAAKEVGVYGMTPLAGSFVADGSWDVEVESSSSFFRFEHCRLIAEGGELKAELTMSSYSYSLVFMGTPMEAAAAPDTDYINYEEVDDYYVFTIPVKALNQPIDCAAFSKRKKKWYARKLLVRADSLPAEALPGIELPDYSIIEKALQAVENENEADEGITVLGGNVDTEDPSYGLPMTLPMEDGRYSINVAIAGGSGRATVSTPTLLLIRDGKAYARLLWSSPYYDWMRVGGVRYENETVDGGNSVFTIPVSSLDALIPIVADTTAMGDPVAIQYTLTFYEESIGDEALIPQEAAKRVVIVACAMIVLGFFLNLGLKKRRKR